MENNEYRRESREKTQEAAHQGRGKSQLQQLEINTSAKEKSQRGKDEGSWQSRSEGGKEGKEKKQKQGITNCQPPIERSQISREGESRERACQSL